MSEIKHPAIRYHGGKFRLAPWVISHFPAHTHYVEPFGGAASELACKNMAITDIVSIQSALPDSYQPEDVAVAIYDAGYRKIGDGIDKEIRGHL